MSHEPPVALTVAGSDSGAGAGIQADLKAMSALGVFAVTAVTAVTAQNTASVRGVHVIPASFVHDQIAAVLADLPVAATKTGMLGSVATIEMVAGCASSGDLANLVVDPVMVSSTGRPLLEEGGLAAYRDHLLPTALMVTPNLWEAALLCDIDPGAMTDIESMISAARTIAALGPRWVLVKGGHLAGVESGVGEGSDTERLPSVPDVLCSGSEITVLSGDRVDTPNTHGTGCSLSAAVVAGLACGLEVPAAVARAKRYVHRALVGAAAWRLGEGHGPLDHFGWALDHRTNDQSDADRAIPGPT